MSVLIPETVQRLLERGVVSPAPQTVTVGEEVRPERIAPGVVMHAGCRIRGSDTSIGPGSVLGREAPMTIENCQLGHEVMLHGGYAAGATFLDGSQMGSGAHVRAGCLLEEQANGAHTVGLKQTLLLPFVTLGSVINFCDCLMAGGTSRSNHSEVGSGFVHFNYTPHGDKATASLIGDVPRGVMLDRPPIFLGGQGGLVGPCRIQYGTVQAAGGIRRGDVLVEGHLVMPGTPAIRQSTPYVPGMYQDLRRVIQNNLLYIGNVRALQHWYREVRKHHMSGDPYRAACHQGALIRLDTVFQERINQLSGLVAKLPRSIEHLLAAGRAADDRIVRLQEKIIRDWPELKTALQKDLDQDTGAAERDRLLQGLARLPAGAPSWVEVVQSLDPESRQAGVAWLQGIVDSISTLWHAA